MADVVRKVEYFSISVPDAPAKAFGVLSTLVSAGVDLLACIGTQRGRQARIDVVPADARRFRSAVGKAKLRFTPEKSGFLIQGRDRAGALADHLEKLGASGINVTGIDALSAGQGRWGAIIWVDERSVRKARQVLGATIAQKAAGKKAAPTRKATKKSKSAYKR